MAKIVLILLFFSPCSFAIPVDTTNSFVVSSTLSPAQSEKEGFSKAIPTTPEIYKMQVTSKVANRFAHTTVLSKVKNVAHKSQEATFSVILPERAFISGFIMEISGKNYTAYVKEKEEAKKTYDEAVASGQGAAHVAVSARDSNRFTVSVNIEPQTKASFYLSYEELLQRQEGRYELLINLHPGQPVKDLSVEVIISENRKLVDLRAPPLRSGNEISNEKSELDPRANIKVVDDKNAVVSFSPNLERQKELAGLLGTDKEQGLSGQFVVQYDVERDPSGGEVLINEGFFIHYFAPSELKAIAKYVVFVLDTSSSMYGQKIVQMREAMLNILEQLHEQDKFSLVEFNSNVKVWNLVDNDRSIWFPSHNDDYSWSDLTNTNEHDLSGVSFPGAYEASATNIKLAKNAVSTLTPDAATDIQTALTVGLHLVELAKKKESKHQPIIIFLTDGEPTVRVTAVDKIITKTTEYNSGKRKSIIFTLSLGEDADKEFLKKIAARNQGFSRHIYEAADTALQLQDFYKQISSPLLANVTFKYVPSTTSLTTTNFPIHCEGSEIVVAGYCGTPDFDPPTVDGWGDHGWIHLKPKVERTVTSLERLWAYLTVKQMLDKKETSDGDQEELKKKVLDLSLKYQFVTSVSSLVVVKPNASDYVEPQSAVKGNQEFVDRIYGGDSGGAPSSGLYTKAAHTYLNVAALSYDAEEDTDGVQVHSLKAFEPSPPIDSNTVDIRADSLNAFELSPPINSTSLISEELPSIQTLEHEILSSISWLTNILKDGILSLREGNYKLGLNETISDVVSCPKTPLNETGQCTLLNECKQIHSLLTSKDIFEEYFCILKNEYAGVCCPNGP